MQYSTVLIVSILSAGAIGSAVSYLGGGSDASSVGAAVQNARASVRDTMREMDASYYRRGESYETCAAVYGARMAGTLANGDITLSCECFDKAAGMLGGLDLSTAIMALGPDPRAAREASAATFKMTMGARRVLRHCNLEPWTGGPALPAEKPKRDTSANSDPEPETLSKSIEDGLRGSL